MAVSAIRTIVVSATPNYGVPVVAQLRWPMAEPDDDLDYSLDVTGPLADGSDTLASASFCLQPSGYGELAAASLSASGGVITVWLSGGRPGRNYIAKTNAVTASGRCFSWLTQILIDPTLADTPIPPPPSTGFGTQLTWVASTPTGVYGTSTYGGCVYA